jgi:hypothetical protein
MANGCLVKPVCFFPLSCLFETVASNSKIGEYDLTTLRTYHLDDLEAVIPEEMLRKVHANGMYHHRKTSVLLAARILIEDFQEKEKMAMAAKIASSGSAKKVLSWNHGINDICSGDVSHMDDPAAREGASEGEGGGR